MWHKTEKMWLKIGIRNLSITKYCWILNLSLGGGDWPRLAGSQATEKGWHE